MQPPSTALVSDILLNLFMKYIVLIEKNRLTNSLTKTLTSVWWIIVLLLFLILL